MLTASGSSPLTALCALAVAGAVGVTGQGAASAQGSAALARADELKTLRAIQVPRAWETSKGNGVIVAVLDTGTDPFARDLAGSVTIGPDYVAGADPAGYRPPRLHGTYISSLIAGHGSGPGRAEGIIGVAPDAKILSVRVILDDQEPGSLVYHDNAGYSDAIARGIRYAVRHGAGVINMSLGLDNPTSGLRQAVGYAISHGVVVVAAAGNNGQAGGGFTPYTYPASFAGVISVAAGTAAGQRAVFSDRNASVVVSAPGVGVAGAGPHGTYLIGSGTSPASALVAGVAALIRSRYPGLPPALVTQAIAGSASHRPPGGYSPGVGFGEVNAAAALAAAGRLASQREPPTMAATAHFGGTAAGPLPVVHHAVRPAVLAAVATAAALGAAGSGWALTRRGRRKRRSHGPSAGSDLTYSPPAAGIAAAWPVARTGPAWPAAGRHPRAGPVAGQPAGAGTVPNLPNGGDPAPGR